MFIGLDLYYTDPVQHLITARQDLDDISVHDDQSVHDLSVRGVNYLVFCCDCVVFCCDCLACVGCTAHFGIVLVASGHDGRPDGPIFPLPRLAPPSRSLFAAEQRTALLLTMQCRHRRDLCRLYYYGGP